MPNTELAGRLQETRRKIASTAQDAGRNPDDIKLIAVSKTRTAEEVRTACEAGQRAFGENRIQEIEEKAPALPEDCEWHMIGHLQRNKVKSALDYVSWIHSVDSERLLNRIERIAAEKSRRITVLLQVNMSGEESKYGLRPEGAPRLLEKALECSQVDCKGLMTMAPFGADAAELHRVFGGLRELRDRLQAEFATPLPELSMGMTSDFETAIREGATLVRIGTAIFGPRG